MSAIAPVSDRTTAIENRRNVPTTEVSKRSK
jgi:hypothetical protein